MFYIIKQTLQLHEDVVALNDVALSQSNNVNVIESLALHSIKIQWDDTSCQFMTKKIMDNNIKLENIMTLMNRVKGLLMKYIIKHWQILLLHGGFVFSKYFDSETNCKDGPY